MQNLTEKNDMQKCRIDLPVQNWHKEFKKFWVEHSKIWKICTLMGCFWQKYIMFELRKYSGFMFDGTQDWCKVWRKSDVFFQKWHEEFSKFSPEHLKVKIEILMAWFCLKSKMYEPKICMSYVPWQWRMMQKLKMNWFFSSKLT